MDWKKITFIAATSILFLSAQVLPAEYDRRLFVHGADKWDAEKRKQFANDQENLIPVLASANRAKSDKGPDEWLPPNEYFWNEYLSRFEYVCKKYAIGCQIPGK